MTAKAIVMDRGFRNQDDYRKKTIGMAWDAKFRIRDACIFQGASLNRVGAVVTGRAGGHHGLSTSEKKDVTKKKTTTPKTP